MGQLDSVKRILGIFSLVACVSIFMLAPSRLPADQAAPLPEPPPVSPTQTPVPRLSFGSRLILERLWTNQDLQREWSPNPSETPPPANAKPLTSLPPVPSRWQNSLRGVSPVQGRKVVALTFDLCEGAREVSGYDARVVNYLRARQVKATFFAGGKWLRSHPEKAMQLMADPLFEVGNHSWDHPHFQSLSDAAMADQVLKTQAQYEALWQELASRARAHGIDPAEMDKIPRVPAVFRFPYGTCNPQALGVLARLGLPAIQWSIVTGDPDKHQYARRIATAVLSGIHPGAIIICHANGRGVWTADALPLFVPQLMDQGYTFVTVSELLRDGPALATPDCRQ
jgi:peptidoglycan-N-acetylglucosamine deacetylase